MPRRPPFVSASPDAIRALPLDMWFDCLGMRLHADKAAGKTLALNWRFTDTQLGFVLNLESSALTHMAGTQAANADATITLTRAVLDEISLQRLTFPAGMQDGRITVTGSVMRRGELMQMLDTFTVGVPVVEPRPPR